MHQVRCKADYGRRDITGWNLPVDYKGVTGITVWRRLRTEVNGMGKTTQNDPFGNSFCQPEVSNFVWDLGLQQLFMFNARGCSLRFLPFIPQTHNT
jgi:hypothetical protein